MKFLRRRALFLLLLISQVEVLPKHSTIRPLDVKALYLNQISTTISDCPEDWVYIPSQEECLPKVGLGFDCEKNRQCNSVTEHSYCKAVLKDDRVFYECHCLDGYKSALNDGPKCEPIKRCSHSGFNEEYRQFDCEEFQFCRLNVCQCGVDYHFHPLQHRCVNSLTECHDKHSQVFMGEAGCFEKASLGGSCRFDKQCSALEGNSFCSNGTCACETGFTAQLYSCIQAREEKAPFKEVPPPVLKPDPKIQSEVEKKTEAKKEDLIKLRDREEAITPKDHSRVQQDSEEGSSALYWIITAVVLTLVSVVLVLSIWLILVPKLKAWRGRQRRVSIIRENNQIHPESRLMMENAVTRC